MAHLIFTNSSWTSLQYFSLFSRELLVAISYFLSALPDLRFHICNFPFSYSGRGEDMVSYERPIWEFVFDRVADLDKKSILLVMYSDLFTARAPRCLPPAKVFGSQLGWIFRRGLLLFSWEKRSDGNKFDRHVVEPSSSRWRDCLQVVPFNPLFLIPTTLTLIRRTHRVDWDIRVGICGSRKRALGKPEPDWSHSKGTVVS